MPYCCSCGNEVNSNAKFCPNCGAPTKIEQNTPIEERKQEWAGKIIKCPSCGEVLPSFTAICPTCGHEINSAKVSDSLAEFISKIEDCDRRIANSVESQKSGWSSWSIGKKIGWIFLNLIFSFIPLIVYLLRPLFRTDKNPSLTKDEKVKATIIENFAFPNERESILEALLYIKSKIALLSTERKSANNAYWARLWMKKAEGLYKKAELMFPGDKIAEEAYSEIVHNSEKVLKSRKTLVLLTVLLLIAFLGFISFRNGAFDDILHSPTPVVIPETELSKVMPVIENGFGRVVTNNDTYFGVEYNRISESDFENYKKMCLEKGYTIDVQNNGSLFDAYNSDGYNIRVTFFRSEMHITITNKMSMGKIVWPNSILANSLPIPKSNYGKLSSSSDSCMIIYVGNMSIDDFNNYVNECIEKGFDRNLYRSDDHFHADNDSEYHVIIEYRGYDTIFIRIDK